MVRSIPLGESFDIYMLQFAHVSNEDVVVSPHPLEFVSACLRLLTVECLGISACALLLF